MAKKPFKIIPERRVGKTQILFRGDPEKLDQVREFFSSIRSSEVYPSFDEEYKSSLFFYETSESFLKKLYRYAKKNLSGLKKQEKSSRAVWIKWSLASGAVLFLLYFFYQFVTFIISALALIQK